jgi:UDP-N-acetylmuramate dehydrogenase
MQTVTLAALQTLEESLRGALRIDEPMALHTTFRIGGKADLFLSAWGIEDLRAAQTWAREQGVAIKVIGNGSNLLVADRGIRGLVVKLSKGFTGLRFSPEGLEVGAGAKLAKVVQASATEGYSGLESTVGIPGTMGGALAMNAGTDTGSIGDLVLEVTALDEYGQLAVYPRSQLIYRYRWSNFSGGKFIILGAKLALQKAPPAEVQDKIERLLQKRAARQPLKQKSAGSVFKNPEAIAAGKLLDRAGAKGMRVGEAEVSFGHANFIVNRGQATAAEVRGLIEKCQQLVRDNYGIELEREVEFAGDWD